MLGGEAGPAYVIALFSHGGCTPFCSASSALGCGRREERWLRQGQQGHGPARASLGSTNRFPHFVLFFVLIFFLTKKKKGLHPSLLHRTKSPVNYVTVMIIRKLSVIEEVLLFILFLCQMIWLLFKNAVSLPPFFL